MDRVIEFLVTLAVAFTLGVAWENRPPVHETLPWWTDHFVVGLPDSRAVKAEAARDAARAERDRARAAAQTAEAAKLACDGRLQAQTAQTLAISEAGRVALAEAQAEVILAQAHAAQNARRAATANAYRTAPGADSCQDLLAADAVALRALQ